MPKSFLLFIFSVFLYAEQEFTTPVPVQLTDEQSLFFNAQYRGRFDIYDGINKVSYGEDAINAKGEISGDPDDVIYLQQIIAGISYFPSDLWSFKASMYDSRSWGSSLDANDFIKNRSTQDEYTMSYYDDHHELFETYIKKDGFLTEDLTLTIGRQQLGYGDRRIFGPGKWGNTMGWLWDAAHLSYAKKQNFVDLWYGQTRIKEPDDFSILQKHRYQGVGLYSHFESSKLRIEPFMAYRNTLYHTEVPDENAYYYGARLYDDSAGVIYDVTAVDATGTYGSLDIDAYAYAAKLGYQWENSYQTRFTLGSIYATGDENPNDMRKQTFSAPFGANDGLHYGRMDIMIWANMQDYQATLSFKPIPKLFVETAYHHFSLAQASDKWYTFGYKNQPGNSYKEIGDEYDLILKYTMNKDLKLLGIYTYLNAGDFITKNDISQKNASKLFLQFLYSFSTR